MLEHEDRPVIQNIHRIFMINVIDSIMTFAASEWNMVSNELCFWYKIHYFDSTVVIL